MLHRYEVRKALQRYAFFLNCARKKDRKNIFSALIHGS